MEFVTRFQCAVCGKITGGRLPRHGDGTFYFPRHHASLHGDPCPGIFEGAEWVQVPVVQKPVRPA